MSDSAAGDASGARAACKLVAEERTRVALQRGDARWLVLRFDDDDIHPVDRYLSARKGSAGARRCATAGGTARWCAVGGVRNWDYRFVWLRDAAFTLSALDAVGHEAEADAFMRFLKRVCRHEGGDTFARLDRGR